MFSKIDKKILTIVLVFFVVILLIGVFIYINLNNNKPNPNIENSLGGTNTESPAGNEQNTNPGNNQPQVEVKVEPDNSSNSIGTFTICVDECGNGVCQAYDPDCETEGLNCICSETHQDCPQDCK